MYLDSLIEGYSGRLVFFVIFCMFTFGGLEFSLWRVQLQKGDELREKISVQSLRKARKSPVRGRILTSDGVVVADSKPIFDAVFHVSEMRQPGKRSKTVAYVAKKVVEAAAVMGRMPEALAKENLQDLFKNSFSFSRARFDNFWNSRSEIKNKFFSELDQQEAWSRISNDIHFAVGIEQDKDLSFRYKPLFRKIANARSVAQRLYHILNNSDYAEKLAALSKAICEKRQEQLLTLPEKVKTDAELAAMSEELINENGYISPQEADKTTVIIKEIIKIVSSELSEESVWRKLCESWRWRRGVADIVSQQELIIILGKKYPELVEASVLSHIAATPALPYKAFVGLDERELGSISEAMHSIPGLEVQINCQREYLYDDFGSHFLGVTGKKVPKDYEEERFFYVLPELYGRTGLESTYDELLRGAPGRKVVQVDIMGYSHEVIEEKEAVNGSELILNIDSKAQLAAQNALQLMSKREGGRNGAVVLLDCRNGAVLAMASLPTFSLSEFDYTELNADQENKPLLNRAMSERYTPGSIVKPMVALAALQSGAVQPDYVHFCDGYHYVDPEKKKGRTRCASWRRGGHGEVDVLSAIEQSCNPFFNTIGIETTFDVLRPYYLRAGFGEKSGIDVESSPMMRGEVPGYVPTRKSKRKYTGIPWNSWDTAQISMGQADMGVTPLQAACYAAAIANGGTVFKPRLVNSIVRPDGTVEKSFSPEIKSSFGVDQVFLDLVRQGMHQVVWGDHASAKIAREAPIALAGKTGTAEVGPRGRRRKRTWFICYGPEENPKYAVAAFVDNGRSGGRSAAPMVVDLFNSWLGTEKSEN